MSDTSELPYPWSLEQGYKSMILSCGDERVAIFYDDEVPPAFLARLLSLILHEADEGWGRYTTTKDVMRLCSQVLSEFIEWQKENEEK